MSARNHLSIAVDNEKPVAVEALARPLVDKVEVDYRKLRDQYPVPPSLTVDVLDLPNDVVLARAVEMLYSRGLVAEFHDYNTAGGRSGYAQVHDSKRIRVR